MSPIQEENQPKPPGELPRARLGVRGPACRDDGKAGRMISKRLEAYEARAIMGHQVMSVF
jgi:hypothetical protein